MDAKIKAKYLFKRFCKVLEYADSDTDTIETDKHLAKECALILSNEIIVVLDNIDELKHETNQHYWNKVKEEISKL